jgi:RNA polymerase sigma-70 factor (sigma-E family)
MKRALSGKAVTGMSSMDRATVGPVPLPDGAEHPSPHAEPSPETTEPTPDTTSWAPLGRARQRLRPQDDSRSREEVVESLFREHYEGLLRLAYCMLGDRCSAEDVVMDAFCSLHLHYTGLRDRSRPLAYLRSAVLNGSRSRIRSLVRERNRPGWADPPPTDSSSASVIAHEEAHRLAEAVRGLPHRQREVVVCRYYLELSEAETAALLGMSAGSVKRHGHRARAALASRMEGDR